MTRIRRAAGHAGAIAALALGATAAATGTAQADATDGAAQRGYEGCPHGAACIYPDASWNADPEHVYWTYGAHPLHNEFGVHRVLNNQTDGATVRLCKGADGTDCGAPGDEFTFGDFDLTPYNSIRLDR